MASAIQSTCLDDYCSVTDAEDHPPLTVHLENVHFAYSPHEPLLSHLNVRVAQGGVYSLLGPSGCGKSTVIKIIMGLVHPSQGQVRVYGQKPNTRACPVPGVGVGYMPQSLSLMATLTARECLHFYGTLNGMSITQIWDRCEELSQLLDIPTSKMVNTMSGGQQRRVSLAVALLHSPPLLILDEPTVGVDPMLRSMIWDYMIKLTDDHKRTVSYS